MENNEQLLAEAIQSFDEEGVERAMHALVDAGASYDVVFAILQEELTAVEEKFDNGEYFLGDFIMAGSLIKLALEILLKDGTDPSVQPAGTVVMGVVKGDIHDLGKDLVIEVLKAEHYSVIDLGVDVSAGKFIEAIELHHPDLVMLSGVMGVSPLEMKKVIDHMNERGIHATTPVIIGGACANEFVRSQIGADAYGEKPTDTLALCKEFMSGKRGVNGC